MRDIKFRGKQIDNGQWVYGYYMKHYTRTPAPIGDRLSRKDIDHLILSSGVSDWNMPRPIMSYRVHPESVGMFTGLKDKNGVEIYEGDIIDSKNNRVNGCECAVVEFVEGKYELKCKCGSIYASYHAEQLEVIGNIHENPELLK